MAFCHLREPIQRSFMYRMSLLLGKDIESTNSESTGERTMSAETDRGQAWSVIQSQNSGLN